MVLSRDEILKMPDLTTKEIEVPATIKVWAGKKIYIKQLTRGDQDQLLKRQFGAGIMRGGKTEIEIEGFYGNDSWVCARGICNEKGERLFSDDDIANLDGKSGKFIGWAATEILKFSGLVDDLKDAKTAAGVKEELKN